VASGQLLGVGPTKLVETTTDGLQLPDPAFQSHLHIVEEVV
jgi:hypothetical protein